MRNVMRVLAVACAVGLGVAVLPAQQQPRPDDKDAPLTEAQFVAKAASSGMHEVELGKLATANAENPDVKKFAERLVTDHSKMNDGLKAAAKTANIPVPDKITPEHQKEVDRFRTLKGADFDRAYIPYMVKAHESSEMLFSKGAKDLREPGLKGFAEKHLPMIQEHLKTAKQLNEKLGKQ